MEFIKKSLRAKFTVILILVGIVPFLSSAAFFYFTAKSALFDSVYKELKWNVNDLADHIEGHFRGTARDLVLASKNIAFEMYFLDPSRRAHWVEEQKKTLKHLRSLYPESLDEACFIDSRGRELSRIVLDRVADEGELSLDEERASFFKSAFKAEPGEVFQGSPTISEDTKRWVLPNATPIVVNGGKVAILHFEVAMDYFQRLLKKSVNPARGYAFIINDRGEFMAHTLLDISEMEPFPKAQTSGTPHALNETYKKMMAGESGIGEFRSEDKNYYISYRPVRTNLGKGVNENRWFIGYVIPSDKVYVEMAILRYNIIAMGIIVLVVFVLANAVGAYVTRPIKELADATGMIAKGEMPRVKVDRTDEIGALSASFNMMAEAIKRRDEALRELAITDGLTGLYNQRYFTSELDKAVKAAKRFNRPISLIMADVDWFKNYNDAYGHVYGDTALKLIASVLLKSVRGVDTAARYGGEEFAVILQETGLEGALVFAERIRKKVEEEDFPFGGTQPGGRMTVSIGVAALTEDIKDAVSFIKAADAALYKAKELGRNRVYPTA